MKKIIFVCHGNICRSPAGEFIMKSLSSSFDVSSKATSYEETGNDIYPPMKRVLSLHNIPISRHYASHIERKDIDEADYVFYMDEENLSSLIRQYGNNIKYKPIWAYSSNINEIEDSWYTGRYELVYQQIYQCVLDILKNLK